MSRQRRWAALSFCALALVAGCKQRRAASALNEGPQVANDGQGCTWELRDACTAEEVQSLSDQWAAEIAPMIAYYAEADGRNRANAKAPDNAKDLRAKFRSFESLLRWRIQRGEITWVDYLTTMAPMTRGNFDVTGLNYSGRYSRIEGYDAKRLSGSCRVSIKLRHTSAQFEIGAWITLDAARERTGPDVTGYGPLSAGPELGSLSSPFALDQSHAVGTAGIESTYQTLQFTPDAVRVTTEDRSPAGKALSTSMIQVAFVGGGNRVAKVSATKDEQKTDHGHRNQALGMDCVDLELDP